MLQPDDNYYCGLCGIDCGDSQFRQGCRWHKYGDFRHGEVFWIYLCKGCGKYLWRLYSKDEYDEAAEVDPNAFYKGFGLFLKQELERLRAR